MKTELLQLANEVRLVVTAFDGAKDREIVRRHEGDPHFQVDELAEQAVFDFLRSQSMPAVVYSEDRGVVQLHPNPEWIFVVDPIDGTRPAMAAFESACFSVAVVPYCENPTFSDIQAALVMELNSGDYYYADEQRLAFSRLKGPALSSRSDVGTMFWSLELTAHPVRLLTSVYGDLIDGSVAQGGVFVFTSSSYSLTRIVTGQLDAHVDIGHGILRYQPNTEDAFRRVGKGQITTLFTYDIAGAAYILARSGGIITDALGKPLDDLPLLTDKRPETQCSIIAASNKELHQNICTQLNWKSLETLS